MLQWTSGCPRRRCLVASLPWSDKWGARLFERTTRSLRPTEIGGTARTLGRSDPYDRTAGRARRLRSPGRAAGDPANQRADTGHRYLSWLRPVGVHPALSRDASRGRRHGCAWSTWSRRATTRPSGSARTRRLRSGSRRSRASCPCSRPLAPTSSALRESSDSPIWRTIPWLGMREKASHVDAGESVWRAGTGRGDPSHRHQLRPARHAMCDRRSWHLDPSPFSRAPREGWSFWSQVATDHPRSTWPSWRRARGRRLRRPAHSSR